MTTSALTLLLLACALYQAESSCKCPSSHPSCESGKCYYRSDGGWSWKGLSCGSCTSSYLDPRSKLKSSGVDKGLCYSYYGNSGDWCWTKKHDGTYATSKCGTYDGYSTKWCCPDNKCKHTLKKSAKGSKHCYSYYGSSGDWCYTRTKNYDYAKSACKSYNGYSTDWCCPSGGCSAGGVSPLGEYIAKFAKDHNGVKVYSKKQESATCWDLAWAAMESAQANGYHPVFYQEETKWADSYKWSSVTVPVEKAQPGDIAQFKGWKEAYLYAWNPHTAIVTDFYKDGTLFTYQQNPNPVAAGNYHPAQKTSGSVTIYRLQSSSRLRLFSEMSDFTELHPGMLAVAAGVGSFTCLLAFAFIMKRRQRGWARAPKEEVQDENVTLYPESDNLGGNLEYCPGAYE